MPSRITWNTHQRSVEGYHLYGEGLSSVQWRIFSTVEGYHQYGWGRVIISTLVNVRCSWGISSVQCSQNWKSSTILMISLNCTNDIPPLYCTPSTVLHRHSPGWFSISILKSCCTSRFEFIWKSTRNPQRILLLVRAFSWGLNRLKISF